MTGDARRTGWWRRQSGATAVEFALVFPILLTVVYSGVVYSYVFLLQQAINFTVQQGAQAAVAVVPQSDAATTNSQRVAQAQIAANSTLSWLPAGQSSRFQAVGVSTCGAAQAPPANSFAVQGSFTLTSLFPTLVNLPLVGSVPALPTTLFACAVSVI